MTQEPAATAPSPITQTSDIIQEIRTTRRGSIVRDYAEIIERVREYEKAESQNQPGVRDGMDRLSLLDPLTELYNYRTFMKELKAELTRAKRYKQACSICLVTVDNYEEAVHQYGFLTGDAVQRVVANVLRSTLREADIPAKYAAQVFAIIYPQTGPAAAAVAAERIRKRVANQMISLNWQSFSVTASIGVASFPAHAESYDELIARAISALEYALERGGDRVLSA